MKTLLLQLILVAAAITASVSGASAQWTSVGSAGTVDEADLAEFDTLLSQVRVRGTATLPATVVVRYNVVRLEGMSGGDGILMSARFMDNGGGARVVSVLKQVNLNTGATTDMLSIDSNDFGASSAFQTQDISSCSLNFDFFNNAYFVETTLVKSSSGGSPRLQALQIGFTLC